MQVPAAQAASEAADFAQESCEAIHIHPFPYDVAFDAWTARILKNNVLQRYTRSRDVTDRMPGTVSLDGSATIDREDTFSLYSLLSDESSTSAFDRADVREWLLGAIAKLKSQAQQQVILDTYFYELDDGEIARRLGKTKNAVYILRYRALQNLKQMLSQAERKKRR
jgi:RNA polymerase sigma factor (sigma-70 family)